MATQYSKASPYFKTGLFSGFMDLWDARKITKNPADVVYTIDKVYQYRPDLLAFDLYGDAALWWVFAVRNPNVIKDPIFDMFPGVTIYLPKKETLIKELGL